MRALVAAFVLALVCAPIAQAQEDDEGGADIPTIICQQSALGQTPGEIADDLHNGDPRIGWGQAANDAWSGLQDCG